MLENRQLRIYLIYGLILILASALRFYQLDNQSLWSDEGNSLALAQAGFREIAARTAHDIHPPFYYWLLKIWLSIFGASEFAARSLSATLAVLLVGVIVVLGHQLFNRQVAITAGLVAAVSPFQVYYAQEVRMYMLLALLGAICVWLAATTISNSDHKQPVAAMVGYAIAVTLGLYTHYAFPVILVAINLVAVPFLWPRRRDLWRWIGLQILPIILYLPWLPTAIRQISTWPSLIQEATLLELILTVLRTLSLGFSSTAVNDMWLIAFVLLLALGINRGLQSAAPVGDLTNGRWSFLITLLWLLLPVGLTIILFRPAYLKFLLVADPPYRLFLALGIVGYSSTKSFNRRVASLFLGSLIAIPSILSLNAYYNNPIYHRDNYRAIASLIEAVARPDDAIILHAPGQQEVFGYYYQPGPDKAGVHPLPKQRPLDPDSTIDELEGILDRAERIYAVYWASEEADPDSLIETWLDNHAFKASDTWFGNVRLVSYAGSKVDMTFESVDYSLGEHIKLTGYSIVQETPRPGEIIQLGLNWETDTGLDEDYTVFVQILDSANHLVGQRDARPLSPTPDWSPGEVIADQHGIVIEPGTPPGLHRLIVGMYDSSTGRRLALADGQDFISLASVAIAQGQVPLPQEAYRISHFLGDNSLLGYDLYKLGHASTPDTPLHAGDPLHLNLYWKKGPVLSFQETVTLRLVSEQGAVVVVWDRPLAGIAHPISNWLTGEIVRAQYDLFLSDVQPGIYHLEIWLGNTPVGETEAFQVRE